MRRLPFRTNATDLSQGELFLFDILFKYRTRIDSLRRASFSTTFNSHSHDLDDSELELTLARLRDRGLVVEECHSETRCIRLTERGGELWSLERCPVWEMYASEHYDETISGKPFVTVVATAASTRDDFLRLKGPGGAWQLEDCRVRNFEIDRHELLTWRSFRRLFVAVAMNFDNDHYVTPTEFQQIYAVLEEQRTWWRNVFELQKFLPAARVGE